MTPKEILVEIYGDKDLIYGHRGASAYAPMNTIPAFELAAEQGADGIELDVHFSKDNELIILHDFTVDETTDGEGVVVDKTLAELKELDAGGWFDDRFIGTKIPTLDEVFEAVGQKLIINVEIKSLSQESDSVEQAVADCIRKHNLSSRVIVSSFNPYVVKRFRPIAPEMPLAQLLYPSPLADQALAMLQPSDYDAIHYFHEMITDDEIAFAKEHNLIINTWTVNDPEQAQKLVNQGVRGIITDKPDIMKNTLT